MYFSEDYRQDDVEGSCAMMRKIGELHLNIVHRVSTTDDCSNFIRLLSFGDTPKSTFGGESKLCHVNLFRVKVGFHPFKCLYGKT